MCAMPGERSSKRDSRNSRNATICLPRSIDGRQHPRINMKERFSLALALVIGALMVPAFAADAAEPNTLTDEEKAAGWKLLFNGTDLSGWHNFKKDDVKPGWQVKEGTLDCVDPHN